VQALQAGLQHIMLQLLRLRLTLPVARGEKGRDSNIGGQPPQYLTGV